MRKWLKKLACWFTDHHWTPFMTNDGLRCNRCHAMKPIDQDYDEFMADIRHLEWENRIRERYV